MNPQLHPSIPMRRFGLNPYAEPLYRVVFSDSRLWTIGGKWPDGACEYREVPMYPYHAWVLEKHMAASQLEYCGSPERYYREQLDPESGLLTCGPYPLRGEYVHCHTFPVEPTIALVEAQIWGIHKSRELTPGERKNSIMDPLTGQNKDWENRFDSIWEEAMPAFRHSDFFLSSVPTNNIHAKREKRIRDADLKIGAKDIPLPKGDNYFFTGDANGNASNRI
jgi:hypothetical protein